jgi:hypothetical protein
LQEDHSGTCLMSSESLRHPLPSCSVQFHFTVTKIRTLKCQTYFVGVLCVNISVLYCGIFFMHAFVSVSVKQKLIQSRS